MKRIWITLAMLVIATVSIPETGWTQGESTAVVTSKISPDSLNENFNSTWIDANGDILAAIAYGGLIKSTDNGKAWKQIFKKDFLSNFGFAVIRDPKTNALLLGTANGIFRSTDDGLNWVPVWQDGGPYVKCFLVKDNTILAGATKGIVQSNDGGRTWKVIFSDSTSGYFGVKAITSNGDNALFAGIADTAQYGIIRSMDNGKTWQKKNDGLVDLHVYAVASDGNGALYAGTGNGLYRSTNDGDNWTRVPLNSDQKHVTEILVVRPDLIFVGFDEDVKGQKNGVLKYDGKSWTKVVADSVRLVMSLAVKDKSLLVGTHNGLYRVDGVIDTPTPVEETPSIPSSFRLEQNYPNPFNPSTTIKFSLPTRINVNLTVYNTLGQVVETLVSSEMGAGIYRVEWNAGSFPSGMYFYQLKANTFVETKRMLLVK